MAENLVSIRITADGSDASAKAKETAGGIKGMFNEIGKGLAFGTGFEVARQGIDLLKDSVGGFFSGVIEHQAAMAQTEAAIKSTGGAAGITAQQVESMGDSFEKVTKFSAETTMAGENLLLTFTGIGKDVFPEATRTMLDMSQALGQDTKSSAIQLGKALNDPIQGVTALQRVGVSFTEEQKAQIKAMQESGNVMGAQKLVLAELSKEFGGSAEAAGRTFGGQLEILKNQLGRVTDAIAGPLLGGLTSLGAKVMPHVVDLAGVLEERMGGLAGTIQGRLQPAFTAIGARISWVVDNITFLADEAKHLGELSLGDLFGDALATFGIQATAATGAAKAFGDFIQNTIVPAFQRVASVIAANFVPALRAAAEFVNEHRTLFLALAGILGGPLVAAVALIIRNWDGLKQSFQDFLPHLQAFGTFVQSTVIPAIQQFAAELQTKLTPIVQQVSQFLQQHQAILLGVGLAITALTSPLSAVVAALVLTIAHWRDIEATFQRFRPQLEAVGQAFTQLATAIQSELTPLEQWLSGTFVPNLVADFQNLVDIWTNQIQPALAALVSFIQAHWSQIEQIFQGPIEAVKVILTGFFDEARILVEGGMRVLGDIITAVMDVIKGDWSGAWDSIKDIPLAAFDTIKSTAENQLHLLAGLLQAGWDTIKGQMSVAWDAMQTVFGAAWDGMKRAAEGGVSSLQAIFTELPHTIAVWLGDVSTLLLQAGRDIITGLEQGIIDEAKALPGKLAGVLGGVKDAVTGFFGIHSPSTVFYEYGTNLMQGLADGITASASIAATAMAGALSALQIAQLLKQAGATRDEITTLTAIALAESGGRTNATSPSGAMGIFQFMPETAAGIGLRNPYDPTQAAAGALKLARLYGYDQWDVYRYVAGGNPNVNYGEQFAGEGMGSYRGFLGQAQAAANAVMANGQPISTSNPMPVTLVAGSNPETNTFAQNRALGLVPGVPAGDVPTGPVHGLGGGMSPVIHGGLDSGKAITELQGHLQALTSTVTTVTHSLGTTITEVQGHLQALSSTAQTTVYGLGTNVTELDGHLQALSSTVQTMTQGLGTSVPEVRGHLQALGGSAASASHELGMMMGQAQPHVQALGSAAESAAAHISALGSSAGTAAPEVRALGIGSASARDEVRGLGGSSHEAAGEVHGLGGSSAEAASEISGLGQQSRIFSDELSGLGTHSRVFSGELQNTNLAASRAGAALLAEFMPASLRASSSLDGLTGAASAAAESAQQAAQAMQQAAGTPGTWNGRGGDTGYQGGPNGGNYPLGYGNRVFYSPSSAPGPTVNGVVSSAGGGAIMYSQYAADIEAQQAMQAAQLAGGWINPGGVPKNVTPFITNIYLDSVKVATVVNAGNARSRTLHARLR